MPSDRDITPTAEAAEGLARLNIGFFTEVYRPVVNGVVTSVDTLAEGLRSRGHEVYCFTPLAPGYEENDAPVLRLPSLPLPDTPYRLTIPLLTRRGAMRIVKRLSLIHLHSMFVTGWMGLRYARRFGVPLVYTYHTKLEEYAHYVPFEPQATRKAAFALTRAFADLVDVVVVPTIAMQQRMHDLGVTSRVEVVPTGVDVQRFGAGVRDAELRERLGVRAGSRMLLFVSRLAKEKNVELVVAALARAPKDLHLVLAGDGPLRGSLEALARKANIADRVTFVGLVDRAALPNLYASADAFVFPSTTETQGLVQVEALASGAFVIAADAVANRDVLGGAGRVVAPTVDAFAAAFAEVPAEPKGAEIERARRRAESFSVQTQTDRMLSIYRSLLH